MNNETKILLESIFEIVSNGLGHISNELYENFKTITNKLQNIENLLFVIITISILSITINFTIYLLIKKKFKEQTIKMLELQNQNLKIQNLILEKIEDKDNV